MLSQYRALEHGAADLERQAKQITNVLDSVGDIVDTLDSSAPNQRAATEEQAKASPRGDADVVPDSTPSVDLQQPQVNDDGM